MCGIFGFITKHGRGPDVGLLKKIATVTQKRGDHAFGLAWAEKGCGIETFKRPGAATDGLDDLEFAEGSQAVIGHCRWATHGQPEDNRNNHPHPAGKGWLVHNGVVRNYSELILRHQLQTKTECDSEVLGLLMAKTGGSLESRAAEAARRAHGDMAVLGLWTDPVRMLIIRDVRPLHFGEDKRGFYFASLAEGLPGKPVPMRNGRVVKLSLDGRQLFMETVPIWS